uniref:Uncharacterized protein n=1 Tax=Rhipicephalus zambeziensis TaxID=60191 RepID=A0A224YCD4_9ACAR
MRSPCVKNFTVERKLNISESASRFPDFSHFRDQYRYVSRNLTSYPFQKLPIYKACQMATIAGILFTPSFPPPLQFPSPYRPIRILNFITVGHQLRRV